MKTTRYYQYMRNRSDRQRIREEWIWRAVGNRTWEEVQLDGRIRRWAWIPEGEKFLRVILLEDGETAHNAFFDRRFRGTGRPNNPETER
jgi:hypothetical protein